MIEIQKQKLLNNGVEVSKPLQAEAQCCMPGFPISHLVQFVRHSFNLVGLGSLSLPLSWIGWTERAVHQTNDIIRAGKLMARKQSSLLGETLVDVLMASAIVSINDQESQSNYWGVCLKKLCEKQILKQGAVSGAEVVCHHPTETP